LSEQYYRQFLEKNEEGLLREGYERVTTEFGNEWVCNVPGGRFFLPSGRMIPDDPNTPGYAFKLYDPRFSVHSYQTNSEEQYKNRPWVPLEDGRIVANANGEQYRLTVVDCGELFLPTGRLVVCDPFTDFYDSNLRSFPIAPGRYQVKVTLFNSLAGTGLNVGEAYASLIIAEGEEVTHKVLPLLAGDEPMREASEEDEEGLIGEGTVCFVDRGAIEYGMPADKDNWQEDVFFGKDGWGNQLDQRRAESGGVILPLPLATNGANIFLMSTAGSEGTYPLVGGYNANGDLIRLHVECFWF
jgi:hypothetical protein